MSNPYRNWQTPRVPESVPCSHCGAALDPMASTSDGGRYEISYIGRSVHTHSRCVELAVIRDAASARGIEAYLLAGGVRGKR